MKRDNLVRMIRVKRTEEEGEVFFEAFCPECDHTDECMAHYGEESQAEDAVIGKIIVHLSNSHGIKADD